MSKCKVNHGVLLLERGSIRARKVSFSVNSTSLDKDVSGRSFGGPNTIPLSPPRKCSTGHSEKLNWGSEEEAGLPHESCTNGSLNNWPLDPAHGTESFRHPRSRKVAFSVTCLS
jgi:hypothetical protein